MENNKVKEQLNSLINVMNEVFNVKKNPLSDYAKPILKDALYLIEEQQGKIRILEREFDEVNFKYFSELTELQGKIEDYERERAKLIRETRLITPRKKSPVRIWIKQKKADD